MASGNTLGATWWTDGFMNAPMMPERLVFARCPVCSELLWLDDAQLVGSEPRDRGHDDYEEARPIVITGAGPNRLRAIKAVRSVTAVTLQRAREIVDDLPFAIEDLSQAECVSVVAELRAAGLEVEWELAQKREAPVSSPPAGSGWAPFLEDPVKADIVEGLATALGTTPERERWLRVHLWWFHNHRRRTDRVHVGDPDAFAANLAALAPLLSVDEPNQRLQLAEIHRELGEFDRALELLAMDIADDYTDTVDYLTKLCRAADKRLRLFP